MQTIDKIVEKMRWIDEFSVLDGMNAGLTQQWLLMADCSSDKKRSGLITHALVHVIVSFCTRQIKWPVTSYLFNYIELLNILKLLNMTKILFALDVLTSITSFFWWKFLIDVETSKVNKIYK